MNDCMSVTKDLPLYCITVGIRLITTNGGVSITGDLLLCCIEHKLS